MLHSHRNVVTSSHASLRSDVFPSELGRSRDRSALARTAREVFSVLERRPKVADVAARAGVSTATVDRVINGRGGVHQKTVARVEEAIRAIVGPTRPAAAVVDPALRFDAVLSGERGGGTKALADAFAQVAAETRRQCRDRVRRR